MAFQGDKIPDLQDSAAGSSDSGLLYTGPRGVAVRILSRAESSDSYIDKLIEQELRINEWTAYDRALLIELIYGTLRWQARLDWVLTGFYHGEFTKCISPVKNAMRVALYQILMLSKIPPSLALSECANTIRRIKDDKSANIITGVLKNILRNVEGIRYPNKEENIQLFYSVTLSHPLWVVKRWCERFGDESAERILSANNDRPSIFLSANPLRSSKDVIAQWLKTHEVSFEQLSSVPDLMRINGFSNVAEMEIFQKGEAFACSASDFKVAQLAEVAKAKSMLCFGASSSMLLLALVASARNSVSTTAVSVFESMVPRMRNRLQLLGFDNVNVVLDRSEDLEKKQADLVVVEADVCGLGLFQTHPHLRWKLSVGDVRKSVHNQQLALERAASHVGPGGRLVYCVASFESEETKGVVDWFLQQHPEFKHEDATALCGEEFCSDGDLQCRLHSHKMDTLFAARFVKTA